jgi:microcystin-dependent protein
MTGDLNMGTNEVTNLPTPAVGTGGDEAASRDYVDTSIDSLFLAAETGDVRMTVDQFITPGWLECDGHTIGNGTSGADHVVPNADLFDLVKLGFGNGGGESFAGGQVVFLPDFRGRSPISRGIGPTTKSGGAGTNHGFGTEDGDEEHTLTVPNMPSHRHNTSAANQLLNSPTGSNPVGIGFAGNPQNVPSQPTGGDGAHNNKSPVLTVLFLIKT